MREVGQPGSGLARLQHMSGSRCRAPAPWDRGRWLLPAVPPELMSPTMHGEVQMELREGGQPGHRRLVGIDLGIASRHSVRVLEADGQAVCRASCVPTVESLARVERAALAGAPEGTRLAVVFEPTGPAWMPIAVFFAGRGHDVYRVSSAKAADLRKFLHRHAKSNGIDAETLARMPIADPRGLQQLELRCEFGGGVVELWRELDSHLPGVLDDCHPRRCRGGPARCPETGSQRAPPRHGPAR